jgi:hypothetical protein
MLSLFMVGHWGRAGRRDGSGWAVQLHVDHTLPNKPIQPAAWPRPTGKQLLEAGSRARPPLVVALRMGSGGSKQLLSILSLLQRGVGRLGDS